MPHKLSERKNGWSKEELTRALVPFVRPFTPSFDPPIYSPPFLSPLFITLLLLLKSAGSIPDGDNGIFHWHNPSGPGVDSASNKVPGSISWYSIKDGQCVGLTTLPPSYADCFEVWQPQPPGSPRAYIGLKLDCFTFYYKNHNFPLVMYVTGRMAVESAIS